MMSNNSGRHVTVNVDPDSLTIITSEVQSPDKPDLELSNGIPFFFGQRFRRRLRPPSLVLFKMIEFFTLCLSVNRGLSQKKKKDVVTEAEFISASALPLSPSY